MERTSFYLYIFTKSSYSNRCFHIYEISNKTKLNILTFLLKIKNLVRDNFFFLFFSLSSSLRTSSRCRLFSRHKFRETSVSKAFERSFAFYDCNSCLDNTILAWTILHSGRQVEKSFPRRRTSLEWVLRTEFGIDSRTFRWNENICTIELNTPIYSVLERQLTFFLWDFPNSQMFP